MYLIRMLLSEEKEKGVSHEDPSRKSHFDGIKRACVRPFSSPFMNKARIKDKFPENSPKLKPSFLSVNKE
jgi:hypothetical protein